MKFPTSRLARLALLALLNCASAQENPPPSVPVTQKPASTASPAADPTLADPSLMRYLATNAGQNQNSTPAILLRGRLVTRNGVSAVILEIDGKFHVLRQGACFSPGGLYGRTSIRLKESGSEGVVLETQPLNQTITLQ